MDDAPCTDCDRVALERRLDAEEAVRAHTRALEKLEREHELTADAASAAEATSLRALEHETEAELAKLFHTTVSDVARGSIDRSRDSAKYVQTASAAIAALYTGLLGLVFSVTDHPLPVRGVYAGVFLGLSVALATAYLAFITRPGAPTRHAAGGSLSELALLRTGYLTRWVNATVHHRRYALRASVLSLGLGVAFVPAPFVAAERAPAIPAAPTAPAIPQAIAPDVAADAQILFREQVAGYTAATEARNTAIAESAQVARDAAERDRDANRTTLGLAVLGLYAVLVGPLLFDRIGAVLALRRARRAST
jgi:hypothetical protein